MSVNLSQLQCKEVISIRDGNRLGFVSDVLIEMPQGRVCAIVVPCPCRNPLGKREDFFIPWDSIQKIGPDIVLVDIHPDSCRRPRAASRHGIPGEL